jgi:tetratricopeptide (TPR) repeat protein
MDSGDERGTLQLLNNLFMLGMLTYQTGMPFLSRIAAEEEHPLRDRLLALTVAANLSAAEGNFNVAAEMADSGLSLCNDQVTLRTRTELHRLKARACHHLEQAEQALAHTRTAQELSRLDSEPLLVMDALRFEGEILRSTGKVDEASVVLEEALAICRVQQARPTELSETLFQCAVAERRSGRTEEARARIDEALEIRMDLQADHGAADCLREVAALERERGDLTLVRARLEHALILYERCGGKGGRAATLGELGDLYRMMGRVSDARRSYEEALRFWEEAGHDGWSDHLRSRLDSTSAE